MASGNSMRMRTAQQGTRRDQPVASLSQILPGTMIDGKYRVDRVLGRGGMGVVLAATHVELHKRVALKFLEVGTDERPGDFEARFALEARVCAKLKNVHIARVHDVSVWQGKFPFMVMDYLEGDDLRHLRKKGERMPLMQAVDYVVQICEGLAEAHAQGIVHRDLKPANIFITKQHDGSDLVKVLDFGISKWAAGAAELGELTKAGEMLGSPKYMSPEQLSGGPIDTRTDVWSIGAILYTMLTGRPPYDFAQVTQTFLAVATGAKPPPASTIEPSVPPAVDAVIAGCMTKDRARRIPNVAELAGALLAAVQSPFAERIRREIRAVLDQVAPGQAALLPPDVSGSHSIFTLTGGSSLPSASERPSVRASPSEVSTSGIRGSRRTSAPVTRRSTAPPRRVAKGKRSRTWLAVAAAVALLAVAAAVSRAIPMPADQSAEPAQRVVEPAAR